MSRARAAALLLLALLAPAGAAHALPAHVWARGVPPARALAARGKPAAFLRLDRAALAGFRRASAGRLDLPLPDGSSLGLSLARFDVLAPGATVTVTGDRGPVPYRPDLTLYRGRVDGEPDAWAVIAMSADEVSGVVQRPHGRLEISPLDRRDLAPGGADHAVSEAPDLTAPGGSFVCPSDDLPRVGIEPPAALPALPRDLETTTTRLVCDIALDCDNEFFAREAGDTARAARYALVLLGTASSIYEREINVTLRCSYLNVWVAADPYAATDLNAALNEFRTYWNANRTGVSRDLAQLVSGRSLGGGIAWVGALCSNYGYSVIGNLSGTNVYPQNATTWDVEVMAHELGHNFSSNHTHSCWWQSHGYAPAGALLDSCYAAEGTCYTGSTGLVPANLGTIMSYCHLAYGRMGDIRLDFHAACKSVMRAAAEAASCFAADAVQPPQNLIVSTGPSGASLSWTASPSTGVIGYRVYRSPWQQNIAPPAIGFATGTSYDDLDLGTYWYKVRAVRAADSSGFCGEVRATICSPEPPVSYLLGSNSSGVLTADFDGDGILDLAVTNVGSNSVSILRGQGTAGAGDGTFAAPAIVALPAETYPVAIAGGDWNGDGILDLAVTDNGPSQITLLIGQGSGGIGNGSFLVGSSLAVAYGPWSLVSGDFDSDGILDLAVACTGGRVSILLGHGSGGVPDGTFATHVDYDSGAMAYGITSADLDEDGIADLALATSAGVSLLRGQGTGGRGDGTFGAPVWLASGISPAAITTGDFDANGITDLVTANSGSGSVSILLGSGGGAFATAVSYTCGINPACVRVGDWNGDGAADLVVPNGSSGSTISILTGHRTAGVADGTFATAQSFPAGTSPRAVGLGDFDHDGQADFAVSNWGSDGQVSIVLAGCVSPLPATLRVTEPAGHETWITNTPHTIRWNKGAGVLGVNVDLSRDDGVHWQTLATGITDTSWTWNVCGRYASQARVRVIDPAVPTHVALCDSSLTIVPAEMLDVPGARAVVLALAGARPNPSRGSAAVWFSLADGSPARLELLDLAGRRLRSIEVGALGPGFHHVDLGATSALSPGLYLIRLSQGGRRASGKLVVTR